MRTEEIVAVMEEKRGSAISLSQLKEDAENAFNNVATELRLKSAAALRQYKADMAAIDNNKLPDNVRQQIDFAKEICETIDSINLTFVNEADKLLMFIEANNTEFSLPEQTVGMVSSLNSSLRNLEVKRNADPDGYAIDIHNVLEEIDSARPHDYRQFQNVLRTVFLRDLIPDGSNKTMMDNSSASVLSRAIACDTRGIATTSIDSDVLEGKVLPHTRKNTERVVWCVDMLNGTITNVGLWGILREEAVRDQTGETADYVNSMMKELDAIYGMEFSRRIDKVNYSAGERSLTYLRMVMARGETPKELVTAMFPRVGFWNGATFASTLSNNSIQNSTHPHMGANSIDMCLGNAGTMFSTQLTEMNYVGIILIITEFLRATNLGDSAGRSYSYFPSTALSPEEYVKAFKNGNPTLDLHKGITIQKRSGDIIHVDDILGETDKELEVTPDGVINTIMAANFEPRQLLNMSDNPLLPTRNHTATTNIFTVTPSYFSFTDDHVMFHVQEQRFGFSIDRTKTKDIVMTSRGIFILQTQTNDDYYCWHRYLLQQGFSTSLIDNTTIDIYDDEMHFTDPDDSTYHTADLDDVRECTSITAEFLKYSETQKNKLLSSVIETLKANHEPKPLIVGSSNRIPFEPNRYLFYQKLRRAILDTAAGDDNSILRRTILADRPTDSVPPDVFSELSGAIVSFNRLTNVGIIDMSASHNLNFITRYGWIDDFYVYQYNAERQEHSFYPTNHDHDVVVHRTLDLLKSYWDGESTFLVGTGIFTRGVRNTDFSMFEGLALAILGGDNFPCRVMEINPNGAENLYSVKTPTELMLATSTINGTPREIATFAQALYSTYWNTHESPSILRLNVFSTYAPTFTQIENPLMRAVGRYVNLITDADDSDLFDTQTFALNIPPRWYLQPNYSHIALHNKVKEEGAFVLSEGMKAFHMRERYKAKFLSVGSRGVVKFKHATEGIVEHNMDDIVSQILTHRSTVSLSDFELLRSNHRLRHRVEETLDIMVRSSVDELVSEYHEFGNVLLYGDSTTARRNQPFMYDDGSINYRMLPTKYTSTDIWNYKMEYVDGAKPFERVTQTGAPMNREQVRRAAALTVLLPDTLELNNYRNSPQMMNEHIVYLRKNSTLPLAAPDRYMIGGVIGNISLMDSELQIRKYPVFVSNKKIGSDIYPDALFVHYTRNRTQQTIISHLIELLIALYKSGVDATSVESVLKPHIKAITADHLSNNGWILSRYSLYTPVETTMVDGHTAALFSVILAQSRSEHLAEFKETLTTRKLRSGTLLGRIGDKSNIIVTADTINLPPDEVYLATKHSDFLDRNPSDGSINNSVFKSLLRVLMTVGEKSVEEINRKFEQIKANYVVQIENTQAFNNEERLALHNSMDSIMKLPELKTKGGK